MIPTHPTIAIIGAGAVGGYYGARLVQHGSEVHFLLRGDYAHIKEHGLQIKSLDGDFSLSPKHINAYADAAQMPKVDLVLVTLKTTANHLFPKLIPPLLKPNTAILTLQNGLGNESQLADLFGPHRILGGMAFVCINRLSAGLLHHSDHGLIKIGEYVGGPSDRTTQITDLFTKSQIRCSVVPDLNFGRWEKLIWNVPFNGLGAALDLTTDRLINNSDGLDLVKALMQEVIDVSASIGVVFSEKIIQDKLDHTQTMGAYRSSMQIDRQMHRPMEIEAIIGEVIKFADANRVTTSVLKTIYHQLRLLDMSDNLGKPANPAN